jgi:Trp operon repressor
VSRRVLPPAVIVNIVDLGKAVCADAASATSTQFLLSLLLTVMARRRLGARVRAEILKRKREQRQMGGSSPNTAAAETVSAPL